MESPEFKPTNIHSADDSFIIRSCIFAEDGGLKSKLCNPKKDFSSRFLGDEPKCSIESNSSLNLEILYLEVLLPIF